MKGNTIEFDNVTAQLSGIDFNRVMAALTIQSPGAVYTSAYKLYKSTKGKLGWNGKVYLMDNEGKFLTGLVPFVTEFLKGNVTLIDNRPQLNVHLNEHDVSLRDYQKEVIDAATLNHFGEFYWPRGVIKVATGGGKTNIAVALCKMIDIPTFFIVHRLNLVSQTVERFTDYGIQPGMIGDGIFDIQKVTVATIQSLTKILSGKDKVKKKELLDAILRTNQLFIDEAHLLGSKLRGGNQFAQVSSRFINAAFRWGLTATPFMRNDFSDFILEGSTGQKIIDIGNAELINDKWLTPPRVKIYTMSSPAGVVQTWPECYDQGVVLNKFRNKKIVEIAKTLPKPFMIFSNFIEHGKILQDMVESTGIKSMFLNGKIPNDERVEAIKALQAGKLDCLVVSTIFDEGVDIPQLKALLFAGGMKSHIKLLQRVGRGLRLADSKSEVVIVDFYDDIVAKLRNHSKHRIKYYNQENFKIEYVQE